MTFYDDLNPQTWTPTTIIVRQKYSSRLNGRNGHARVTEISLEFVLRTRRVYEK